jgi:endonuclease/exonuclease/phosphatase family metal-dependent hydrolase
MASGYSFRKFLKQLLIVFTLAVCVVFVCSVLIPYLKPASWWWLGFIGLLVPYLAIVLLFAVFFWLIVKPGISLLPLVSLLLGMQQIQACFAWHISNSFTEEKADSVIRIVDWNVGSMYGLSNDNLKRRHNRKEIAAAILNLQPDIICLQEFNHSYTQGGEADNLSLFTREYPYHYFSHDYERKNGYYVSGSIIFSKHPIVHKGSIQYASYLPEKMIYADISLPGKQLIRVHTLHLQSYKFSNTDYAGLESIKTQDSLALEASKNIVSKMKKAFLLRSIQAQAAKQAIEKSTYPSIVCGDFNDVPNSYTYFQIKGNKQDAFLKKDFGLGKTYTGIAPTLRIDYILADKQFHIMQFDMVDEGLSDHVMLVSDLKIK